MNNNYFLETLKKERNNYADMINFCCDDLILNNSIVEKYNEFYCDIEVFNGCDYDEEIEEYSEVFQWFIIDENDAERLAEYTNELVYYMPEFNMYVLGVCHYGTNWSSVSANWKE